MGKAFHSQYFSQRDSAFAYRCIILQLSEIYFKFCTSIQMATTFQTQFSVYMTQDEHLQQGLCRRPTCACLLFCQLQRATSKRVFEHLEEKQKPRLANVAANVVGVPQKSTPIKRYSARTAAASALLALVTSRPWLLAHIACVTRNCVCMDHAVSFVRRALPL